MVEMTDFATEKDYIEYKINTWKHSKERQAQITSELYYKGIHDIIKRRRQVIGANGALTEVNNLPNNCIVDNQYSKMVDQKKNYLLGQPIAFNAENKQYTDVLQEVFNKEFDKIIKDIGQDAIIGGLAWLHPYYDEEGNFKFKRFPAYEILPFWANKEHTKLKFAVRYYLEEKRNSKNEEIIEKVELYTPEGIFYYDMKNGNLTLNEDDPHKDYLTLESEEIEQGFNWERIPLIPFKCNNFEIPLLNKCKSIQDAINLMNSDFVNIMAENAGGSSILVLKNYDGEKLDDFRKKLIELRAIKVRSTASGGDGGVDTLDVEVNAVNYETILKLLKRQLIENCRGYDAKDERLGGSPNQMNIKSMYSDLDLDAKEMETEFEASFKSLFWFVNQHLINTGKGNFENEDIDIIFNKDSVVNETEVLNSLIQAGVRIPNKLLLQQVPFIDDINEAEKLLKEEQEQELDIYNGSVPMVKNNDIKEENEE